MPPTLLALLLLTGEAELSRLEPAPVALIMDIGGNRQIAFRRSFRGIEEFLKNTVEPSTPFYLITAERDARVVSGIVTFPDSMIRTFRGAAFGYPVGERLGKPCRTKSGCSLRALWHSSTLAALGQVPGVRTPRAIVIMSSAKEGLKGEGSEEALEAARGSGIPVYFIQLASEHFDDRVNPVIAHVARETGGQVFNAALVAMDTILAKLSELLRVR